MRKVLCLILSLALVIAVAGCKNDYGGSSADVETVVPLIPTPDHIPDLPTNASPTNTLPVTELLAIVNAAFEQAEDGYAVFDLADAEVFDFADSNEVVYVFDLADVQTALFVEMETGFFKEAYCMTSVETETARAYMASFAGAILMALEPNEYVNMLVAVVPESYRNEADDNPEHDHAEDDIEGKSCDGEFWTLTYHSVIMNISPKNVYD